MAESPERSAQPGLAEALQLQHREVTAYAKQLQHGGDDAQGQDGTAATAVAAAAYEQQWPAQLAAPVFVKDSWEQAVDMNSQQPYWFNRATGESRWTLPPGWAAAGEGGAAQPPAQQQQQQAAQQQEERLPAAAVYEPGYYYRDASSQLQGPFALAQLRAWRGALPMDLPIAQLVRRGGGAGSAPAPAQQQQRRRRQEEQQAGQQAAGSSGQLPAAGSAGDAAQQAGAAGAEARWERHVLAGLLGDWQLLERWRLDHPEQAAWPGCAPPAEAYESERQQGSAASLAAAVLSGLPADDEAVALARAAAAAGKSIQEVAEWSRRHSDYSATGYRVAARGRIQAGDGKESLYAEAASWTNPAQLEQQLARTAAARKRQLSGEELRQIRERKKELKRQKQTGWLYT